MCILRSVPLFRVLTVFVSAGAALTIAVPTPTASPSLQPRDDPTTSSTPILDPIVSHTAISRIHVSHTPVLHIQVTHPPTCTQTITPDHNGYVPPGTCNALYRFYPSFAAALLFSLLFGATTLLHIGQAIASKKAFCWVIIVGALWETISFATRTLSTRNQQSTGLALVSQLLVLLAPLWVNAFDYMVLGRMIHFFLPTHSLFGIRASTLAYYFVSLDFVSFIIQLIGGSMAPSTAPPAEQLKGIHVYMGGIGLQQFFIVVFLGLAVKFHVTMLGMERSGALVGTGKGGWRRLLFTLYGSLALISVRIFFRLIEFSAGNGSNNPLPFHEAYFYVFDAVPMFFALVAMNITHPGRVLVGPDSELPKSRCCCCCGGRKRKGSEGKNGTYVEMDDRKVMVDE
ncbi:hypothetical protein MMC06_005902 [Schaereria dolodes]|nr:hypothetical protein [Schaereria dolodes]